jgi:hypothetical protein
MRSYAGLLLCLLMLDSEETQNVVVHEFERLGRDLGALLESIDEFVALHERVEKAEGGDVDERGVGGAGSQTVEKIKSLAGQLQQRAQ